MRECDVREATHVKDRSGRIHTIRSKWGIGPQGELAPPSRGGFGVVTDRGERIGMMDAALYLVEK